MTSLEITNEEIYELESTLKACPCCGMADIDNKFGLELHNSYMYWPSEDGSESKCIYDDWYVVCNECGLQTKKFESPRSAVDSWNMRVE